MRAHLTTLLAPALALTALAACEQRPTEPDAGGNPDQPAALMQPGTQTLYFGHPWAGLNVRIRDYTGDIFDRCLGANARPAANVLVSAHYCYSFGMDSLQQFTIVGFSSGPPFGANLDPNRVALRLTYYPDYCLDVASGTASGGETIQLYPCHYQANQLFHLPLPPNGQGRSATGPILTKSSGYSMAFEAGAPGGGTLQPVLQKPFSSTQRYQRWTLELR
jgi:hypothetical protein